MSFYQRALVTLKSLIGLVHRTPLKACPRQVTNLHVHLGGERRRLHLREELGGLRVLQRRHAEFLAEEIEVGAVNKVCGDGGGVAQVGHLTPREIVEREGKGKVKNCVCDLRGGGGRQGRTAWAAPAGTKRSSPGPSVTSHRSR